MCPDCDKLFVLNWHTGLLVCNQCGQVSTDDSDTSRIIRINYAENLYTTENHFGNWAQVVHRGDVVAIFEHRNAYQAAREYASGIISGYYA